MGSEAAAGGQSAMLICLQPACCRALPLPRKNLGFHHSHHSSSSSPAPTAELVGLFPGIALKTSDPEHLLQTLLMAFPIWPGELMPQQTSR